MNFFEQATNKLKINSYIRRGCKQTEDANAHASAKIKE